MSTATSEEQISQGQFDAKEVIDKEIEKLGIDLDQSFGLALSGGGIRSASFGLGVMQGLVKSKYFHKLDYLSTVSGGGFIGSALSWALEMEKNPDGLNEKGFPFGLPNDRSEEDLKKNNLTNYIRQHGNYLTPASGLGMVSFIAVVFRSVIVSVLFYSLFLTVVMGLLTLFGLFGNHLSSYLLKTFPSFPENANNAIVLALVLGAFYVFLSVVYSLGTYLAGFFKSERRYKLFLDFQRIKGYIIKLMIAFLIVGLIQWVYDENDYVRKELAAFLTTLGGIIGAWRYRRAQSNTETSGTWSTLLVYLGVFSLLLGLLLLSTVLVAKLGIIFPEVQSLGQYWEESWEAFKTISILSLFVALLGVVTNMNQLSPHRIYRNRLMEAFLPDSVATAKNQWAPAEKANSTNMEEINQFHPKPYHIINTNVVLVDSEKSKYRNRGGDNFIFSKFFVGSEATTYRATKYYQKDGRGGITLATAMAASGAALNPNADLGGQGMMRNTAVSILLSILNLGLGYWATNPKRGKAAGVVNFFSPGLRTIRQGGLKESKNIVQVSDGGHFENLGLYELIRRKVKLIIVADGGQDREFKFDDFANAMEKIRVDFGAEIKFREENARLHQILPGTGNDNSFLEKYGIAKNGYAIGNLKYNDGSRGKLIYLKPTMITDLPVDVYGYKGANPDFPHESTADQFFNESQFEAYRALGYAVCRSAMKAEPVVKIFQGV